MNSWKYRFLLKHWSKILTIYLCCIHWGIREDAYSRTEGISIRDTARDTAYSLWLNELWPNQGQAILRVIPRIPRCSKIWRMIFGRMHELKCKKSVVNHFKNPIEAMVMEDKNVSHKSHSVYLIRTENKRGERSSLSYDNPNVSPYGSCYHSFCMRSSGVWNWGCVLPNWWRYGIRYVVVGYEWMIRTASCRINHTLVRDYANRTK